MNASFHIHISYLQSKTRHYLRTLKLVERAHGRRVLVVDGATPHQPADRVEIVHNGCVCRELESQTVHGVLLGLADRKRRARVAEKVDFVAHGINLAVLAICAGVQESEQLLAKARMLGMRARCWHLQQELQALLYGGII